MNHAVQPHNRVASISTSAGLAHDFAALVNAPGNAALVAGKRPQILDAAIFGPEERVVVGVCVRVTREIGKADDLAPIVNSGGRIPRRASEIPNPGGDAILPKHGVLGAISADRVSADS